MVTPVVAPEVISQQVLDAPSGGDPALEPLIVPSIEGDDGYVPETSPASPSGPEPPGQTSDGLDGFTRQRLARADQLERQNEQAQIYSAVQQEIQVLQTEMGNRGYTVEDQNWLAGRYSQLIGQVAQQQQEFRAGQEFLQGQRNASIKIAQEYGVDPGRLSSAHTPNEMRERAAILKENRDFRGRLDTIEKRAVPAQQLNRIGNSRAGGLAVTSDNIDKLHIEGRVTDTTYRLFLDTGEIR